MTVTKTKAPPRKPKAPPKTVEDWSWRITWRGQSWTDNDLTVQHLGVLALLSGGDEWTDLDLEAALEQARLEVVDGYQRLVNMVCAFVIVDQVPDGLPEDAAHQRTVIAMNGVRKAPAVEMIGAFSVNRPG